MYHIEPIMPQNREPWLIPLEKRNALAEKALYDGKKLVLLLYQKPDTSTFRYRAYNMMQATQASGNWQCVYYYLSEIDNLLAFLPRAKAVVLVRISWVHAVDKIIKAAKINGAKVLFDVDDLVFDIDRLALVTNTLNVSFNSETDYDFWFSYIGRIGYTASKADGFICTNDYLGKLLTDKFGKPYGIIPNFLNREQVNISAACLKIKEQVKWKKPFVIGYFSGTPSHINDFRVVYREIMQLLEDFPDMKLDVVGFMEFPTEMKPLIDKGRAAFKPLVDFLELQRLTAQVDVNIVPLVNNTFTNCKSELKFFEAAIVDTVTAATPTFTYKSCIEHRKNGFLCNPGQWYDTIKYIYENPGETQKISWASRTCALERYFGDMPLRQIESCYENMLCSQ